MNKVSKELEKLEKSLNLYDTAKDYQQGMKLDSTYQHALRVATSLLVLQVRSYIKVCSQLDVEETEW